MGNGSSKMDALEALCRDLVDEAVAPLHLPAELDAAIRAIVEDELLLDPEGRLLLRRALGDPVLDHSGDVDSLDDDADLDTEIPADPAGGGKENAG